MENSARNNDEIATDMEYAEFLIRHIEKPCHDLDGNDNREFYIREALRIIPTMTDPEAIKLLKIEIKKYEN